MFNPWLPLVFKTMQLGFEAQSVIALRAMRFAAGGTRAQTEASRMISEKIAAGVEAQAVLPLPQDAGTPSSRARSFEFSKDGSEQTSDDSLVDNLPERRSTPLSPPENAQTPPAVARDRRRSSLLPTSAPIRSRRERPTSKTKRPATR